jgi:hypothetical protein
MAHYRLSGLDAPHISVYPNIHLNLLASAHDQSVYDAGGEKMRLTAGLDAIDAIDAIDA